MSFPAFSGGDRNDVEHALTYRKLDATRQEIRLLVVEPEQDGPIQCKLQHVDLGNVRYETISYVWGDASIRGTIYVDGQKMDVPASSEAVLRRMRSNTVERTLWIDSVCINQTDVAERSQQVAIMPAIFENGFCNLVWLGEDESNTTEQAIASIRVIVEEVRRESEDFKRLSDMLYDHSGNFRYSDSKAVPDVDWGPVVSFFHSAWFSRLWVVQEAALAQYSVCFRGRFEIPLEDVFLVSAWLRFKTMSLPFFRRDLPGLVHSTWIAELANTRCGLIARPFKWDLLPIMTTTRAFLATRREDHVFSLLGLYQKMTRTKVLPEVLMPDYLSSLSEIFTTTTRFTIAERKTLDVLSEVYHRPEDYKQIDELPSWIPWWHRAIDDHHDPYDLRVSLTPFNACGDQRMHPTEVQPRDPEILVVKGFKLGLITYALPMARSHTLCAWDTREDGLSWHSEFESLLEDNTSDIRAPGNYSLAINEAPNQHPLDSYEERRLSEPEILEISQALVGGKNWNYEPINASDAVSGYNAYMSALRENREIRHQRDLPSSASEEEKVVARYSQAMWNSQRNRRAFKLSSGHIGFGPPTTQTGDTAVILYGSTFPAVLRPVAESETGHFRFVGVCYVHGIMHGEAVQQHQQKGGEDEFFQLI